MTTRRLSQAEVLALLPDLADDLTPRQLKRLRDLADLIGEDGTLPMASALEIATTGRDDQARQTAFRQFRRSVRVAASQANLSFGVEVDGQKVAPELRRCWFELADEVDSQLAERSRREASRGPTDRLVGASVREVRAALRVHVSAVDDKKHGEKAQQFLEELRTALKLRADGPWEVTTTLEVPIGVDRRVHRDELSARADVTVALISPAYLASLEETERVAGCRHLVPVPFVGLPPGNLEMRGINRDHLLPGQPYCYASPTERRTLMEHLVRAILVELQRSDPPAEQGYDPDEAPSIENWARYNAERRMDRTTAYVDGRLTETRLESAGLSAQRHLGEPTPAVDRLLTWAKAVAGPHLCALLGDVGTGKTTTAKLLTQRMLDERVGDATLPLPLYFDLRDLPKAAIEGNPTLREILTALLRITDDAGPRRPSVDEVIGRIRQGRCLVIFDGLDEALVHLSPHDQQVFTRTLWRATIAERSSPGGPSDRPQAKLLLTCRTHFFRSIRDEATYFTGEDREAPTGPDYLALLMVPFAEAQIRAYIAANVPDADVDAVIATIDATHNLRELSERPLTLRMIVEQLEYIEQAKYEGRTVRAVDLYGAIVDRWLARDTGKHTLLPQHKVLLMENLAALLWRTGRISWSVQDVEQWLLTFLHQRPDLELHYATRTPDKWKDDFRTATFLVRKDDDEFAFAHTSLSEYFLSQYLLRSLVETSEPDRVIDAWSMPVPSPETLDFLGQSLAGLVDHDRTASLRSLSQLAQRYRSGASELAFAYGLRAYQHGFPAHRLTGAVLDGASLRGVHVESTEASALDLSDVSFRGADLRDAVFSHVRLCNADFEGADLTLAEFQSCDLTEASMRRAILVRPILRACRVKGLDCDGSTLYRAQRVLCTPVDNPIGPGWLPGSPNARQAMLNGELVLHRAVGHNGCLRSVAFDPNGIRLASGADDGTVRIWNAATGELLHTATGHHGSVWSVAFNPDGTRLASGADDGTVRIWNAATGELLHTTTGHQGPLRSVAFNPDGTRLASGGNGGTVRIWNATTGEPLQVLSGHQGLVWSVAFNPDGTRLASGADDGTVRIWNAATGELLHTATGHHGSVWSAVFSPDGTRLASGGQDGSLRTWNAATGEPLQILNGHQGSVWSVAFNPDGTRLASGGRRSLQTWDAATGELLNTVTGPQNGVQSVAYSPDGTRLVSGGRDGSLQTWSATTSEQLQTVTGHEEWVWSVAFSPDGTRLATGGNDGSMRIWNATTGELLHTATGHHGRVWSVAFSPDGTQLATGGDGPVRIWNAATGELLHIATGRQRSVLSVAFSPDGTRLATAGDGPVLIWDAATGEPLHTASGHQDWVRSVAFSPDGTRLATGSNDGSMRIWNAATGELLHTATGHQDWVWSVAFSPDGTQLATGASDGAVRIWNTTGELLHTATGHQSWVLSVAFSPDGARLASGGGDGTVRTWNATGELLHTATGHQDWVRSVAFSPDGTQLASGGDDGTVRIWNAATGEQVGWRADFLPLGEFASWEVPTNRLLGVTEGAWRWLAWMGVVDGEAIRLPAESFGPLPLL